MSRTPFFSPISYIFVLILATATCLAQFFGPAGIPVTRTTLPTTNPVSGTNAIITSSSPITTTGGASTPTTTSPTNTETKPIFNSDKLNAMFTDLSREFRQAFNDSSFSGELKKINSTTLITNSTEIKVIQLDDPTVTNKTKELIDKHLTDEDKEEINQMGQKLNNSITSLMNSEEMKSTISQAENFFRRLFG